MQTEEATITEEKAVVAPVENNGANGTGDANLNGNATTEAVNSGEPVSTTTLVINEEKLKSEKASTEPVFAHLELMAKHGIQAKSLPDNIKNDLKVWAMTRPRMEGDKSGKIIVSLKKRSVVIADAIQDWIEKDYPEKSEEEVQAHINAKDEAEAKVKAEAEAEAEAKAEAEAEAKAEAEVKAKAEADQLEAEAKAKEESNRIQAESRAREQLKAKERREQEEQARRNEARSRMRRPSAPVRELTLEEKQVQMILNGLDASGKIHYDALKKILGRNIGLSDIKVGNSMILRNQYMTNYYYIHKK